jgi:neutral ceramidase
VAVSAFLSILLFLTLGPSIWESSHGLPRPYARPSRIILASNSSTSTSNDGDYLLGVGKGDITGPVVELNFMGYADTAQLGTGLRQRLYCRSFLIGSISEPSERIVYLILDTQSGDTAIRNGILEGLADLGSEYAIYTKDNVAVTGTHSHAGPGAWLNYLLPQITSKGFSKQSYQAIVDGSVLAIKRAHDNAAPGRLSYATARLEESNISRSPYAYLANPKAERAEYTDNVDKNFTLLRFERAEDSVAIGALTWFPVHGTSLYQNNTLVAGDNKGVAAYLMEEAVSSRYFNFTAGFSQSNVGDTSPNTLGAICQDTGLPCAFEDSTCSGKTQGCHGRGPQFAAVDQGTKSCFEIGGRQFQAAQALFGASNLERIPASTISSFHFFHQMAEFNFTSPLNSSRKLQTCSAALGHSFAGGTTDGPGAFDFRQGTNDTDPDDPSLSNPVWRAARLFLHEPSKKQIQCQSPKPILLDVGATTKPYAWSPNIVDIQMLRVGPLIMIIAPGEATTMSGRRWRNAIASAAPSVLNITSPKVVLGGPANTYAHYIATEEEYGVQRYEGASTLYGPHTLEAYIRLTVDNLGYLGSRDELPTLAPGPKPPINTENSWSFIDPVVVDNPNFLKKFGQSLSSPSPDRRYEVGDVVSARFVGANPRNNLRLEGTFAAVELFNTTTNTWEQVRNDKDWFLVYKWKRTNTILGHSEVTIEWEIEPNTPTGLYRVKYYGDAKAISGKISTFEGTSGVFNVRGSSTAGSGNEGVGELVKKIIRRP